MRIKLMLDHIYELKNNKQSKAVQQDMDTTVMIKRTLKRTYESQLPLNVGLFDIRNIDKNGRWWILGAQYGQKVVNENRKPLRDPSNKRTTFGNIIANCDPKILAIAKKMNMNTELRQYSMWADLMILDALLSSYWRRRTLWMPTRDWIN